MIEITLILLVLICFMGILFLNEKRVHSDKIPFSKNLYNDKKLFKE